LRIGTGVPTGEAERPGQARPAWMLSSVGADAAGLAPQPGWRRDPVSVRYAWWVCWGERSRFRSDTPGGCVRSSGTRIRPPRVHGVSLSHADGSVRRRAGRPPDAAGATWIADCTPAGCVWHKPDAAQRPGGRRDPTPDLDRSRWEHRAEDSPVSGDGPACRRLCRQNQHAAHSCRPPTRSLAASCGTIRAFTSIDRSMAWTSSSSLLTSTTSRIRAPQCHARMSTEPLSPKWLKVYSVRMRQLGPRAATAASTNRTCLASRSRSGSGPRPRGFSRTATSSARATDRSRPNVRPSTRPRSTSETVC
jgi:hypothetical protein